MRTLKNDCTICFRTNKNMYDKLSKLAQKHRCSIGVIIRKLIFSYLVDIEVDDDEYSETFVNHIV